MKNKWLKIPLLLLAVVFLALAAVTALRLKRGASQFSDEEYLRLVPEMMELIKQKYVEKVDDKKLVEGAISGMLAALDPHSSYLPPDFFREMNIEISGSFGGLGLEVTMSEGRLTVIAPIDDTPAHRAGIKAGDFIWKIDGKSTLGLNINEAVKRMRGPKGTRIDLTIIRKNVSKPLAFNLVRAIIRTKSLKARTLEPGYGYVRISHFQEGTGEEFAAALRALRRENGGILSGLVIDLRNNPGGLLEPAVTVAGRFIDPRSHNGLVVYTKGREESSRMTLTAARDAKEPRYPVVVLINGGSASASEIVAGALQDHKRAVIMGTQSFGKGSVQTVFSLPGGAGLKLTTARYYTPNGRSIQAKGITPDVVVESNDTPHAPKKQLLTIREEDLDNHFSPEEVAPPVAAPAPAKQAEGKGIRDNQLDRALDLLKGIHRLGPLK
ncbi:MAG TPA: S41 family peptidase [Geobacteraceae bacterium]|jgi:carboxyl-terminal processing protease|nr:S41 family peptidase [Geobacteraceae bacterium]